MKVDLPTLADRLKLGYKGERDTKVFGLIAKGGCQEIRWGRLWEDPGFGGSSRVQCLVCFRHPSAEVEFVIRIRNMNLELKRKKS